MSLLTLPELLSIIRADHFTPDEPYSDAELARRAGMNREVARIVTKGKRLPSKAFLDACGYERVTLYRRKAQHPLLKKEKIDDDDLCKRSTDDNSDVRAR